MSWWDRYQGWQLESRAHYVPTTVGFRALIVFLATWLYLGWSAGKALLLTAIIAALGTLVFWFWYPRAKAKSKQAGEWERTSSVVQNDRMHDDQLDGMQRFYRQRS
jgi:Zn-dependent protease with chaperone function